MSFCCVVNSTKKSLFKKKYFFLGIDLNTNCKPDDNLR